MEITETIKEQMRQVRDSGNVNMMSARDVMGTANDLELYDLVSWFADANSTRNPSRYLALLNSL